MTKTTKNKPEHAWDNPEIPHKGWTEERVVDLEQADHTCEMCGKKDIRFVHTMSHPEYPTTLNVGCECAIHMSDDYTGPRETKRVAKNLSNNKQAWFANTEWEDYDGYTSKTVTIPPSSYRTSRSIIAVASQQKHQIWKWKVSADNGKNAEGLACNRQDAKQRIEQYVKNMQAKRD